MMFRLASRDPLLYMFDLTSNKEPVMKKIRLLAAAVLLFLPAAVFAEAGWDNGFYIKSEDGDFKMNIGGRIQMQEVIQKRSATEATPGNVARTAPNNFSDTFKIRRARVQTTGALFEKLEWFTILNTGTGAAGAATFNTIWMAGFTYNFTDYFRVSSGMVQLPMDRMGENSSAWFLGIEPPLTATQEDGLKDRTIARTSFGLPFDLGIRIDGDVGQRFSYALAAGNGSGDRALNANNELSYGARAQVNVMGKVDYMEPDFAWSEKPNLSIGLGTGFEDEDQPDGNVAGINRLWSWSASGDIAFRYRGFSLNTEAYHRILKLDAVSIEDTNRDRKLRDIGYYANAGYFVVPKKVEFMLTAAQIFREGADNNSNEFGGGLNWYIKQNKVKMQLDYTNVLDYDEVPGLNNATYHRIRVMFSMFI